MALGYAYDSPEGRAWAAALTSLMTGHAYATSARTAARLGAFEGYAENAEHMTRVLGMHRDASYEIEMTEVVPNDLIAAGQAFGKQQCATEPSTVFVTLKHQCSHPPARSVS